MTIDGQPAHPAHHVLLCGGRDGGGNGPDIPLGLLWCVRQWPGEAWWVGVVLVYAPQTIWAVAGILAMLGALLARDVTSALCAVGSALLVLFGFMGLQWNSPAQAPDGRALTVATWNLCNEWRHAAHARAGHRCARRGPPHPGGR